MQFNVAQQLKGPLGSVRTYGFDGHLGPTPVVGQVTLTRTDAGILVQADCRTQATWTCARCAVPYSQPLTLTIEEEFFPTRGVISGASLEVEDGAFRIDAAHVLDLTEAVGEYTLLALPVKPLCRPVCAGLCPQCGANLNEASCACSARSGHPVLAELGQRWAQRHAS